MDNEGFIITVSNLGDAIEEGEKRGIPLEEMYVNTLSINKKERVVEIRRKTQDELDSMRKRNAEIDKQEAIRTARQNQPVRCPKCGSTQIQMVQRKWSLMTGFLTNKTDRVCVNCKHRW